MRTGKSDYDIIRVTPTLLAEEHHNGDVICTQVEIPAAVVGKGGTSRLKSVFCVDYGSESNDMDFVIVFTEKGTTAFGTQNTTANISDADLVIQKVTSYGKFIGTEATTAVVDNVRLHQMMPASLTGESNTNFALIKADESSTSVYFHCIINGVNASTNPTFTANQLEFIFHIEK